MTYVDGSPGLNALASGDDLVKWGDNRGILFALELDCRIEDIESVAADAITDGPDDKKCDLVYVDPDSQRAIVGQAYWATDLRRPAASASKASELNTAASWLLSGSADIPERLKPAAAQLVDALET